jgi:hypothetical protein
MMAIDSSAPLHSKDLGRPEPDESAPRDAHSEEGSELTTVNGIVGAAMVGLLGGGPRLAIRAARVVLEDSYGSRSPVRRGRLRGRVRRRGE